jgi:hypothetical protein
MGYMIRLGTNAAQPSPTESLPDPLIPLYIGYLQYDPSQPSSLTTNDWGSKKLLRIT